MTPRKYLLCAIVGALFASTAGAQESLVEYVRNSCKSELENFCSTVNPGEGRLMLCFGAHADQLSERCEFALYQASAALEQAVAAIGYVGRACRDDIVKLCPETQPGDGRVLECLDEKQDQVSQRCKDAVSDVIE
ncbi:MAG: hypothetical protein HKN81_01350 [Gammaproteobacteria bacterium]|nr:cysteine rich repeat-containing protein [Gammaproteobacteria bacterium]NND35754.1 hypothetical protein [Gammaproteobacteria bacterium]